MKILIDMNLAPAWVEVLQADGWDAVHWSTVGHPSAIDQTIMDWARAYDYVVFTHDLDFGAILAVSHAAKPSVIQVRTQDLLPQHLSAVLLTVLRQYQAVLEAGALIVVDEQKLRVRILPLTP